jgi:hypothetical protein
MSDWEDTCQALADLLTLNVSGLAAAVVHRLVPYDPAELRPDGDRHLAVWPVAEPRSETAEPLTLDSVNVTQLYRILVWEAGGESRGVLDEQGASDLLNLHNAVRRMFHPFRTVASAWKLTYRGTAFPERSLQVRYFEMEVAVDRAIEFAAP